MKYKMIVLQLLQECPLIYDRLIRNRTLLPALEAHAEELRANHHAWQDRLWQTKPDSDATQVASEAMELALKELENRLHSELPLNDNQPLSLDAAIAFIRRTQPV